MNARQLTPAIVLVALAASAIAGGASWYQRERALTALSSATADANAATSVRDTASNTLATTQDQAARVTSRETQAARRLRSQLDGIAKAIKKQALQDLADDINGSLDGARDAITEEVDAHPAIVETFSCRDSAPEAFVDGWSGSPPRALAVVIEGCDETQWMTAIRVGTTWRATTAQGRCDAWSQAGIPSECMESDGSAR